MQRSKKLSNLTFNNKVYLQYMKKAVQMSVDGDRDDENLVQLLEYLVNPVIKIKNFILLQDISTGIKNIEDNETKFRVTQSKL